MGSDFDAQVADHKERFSEWQRMPDDRDMSYRFVIMSVDRTRLNQQFGKLVESDFQMSQDERVRIKRRAAKMMLAETGLYLRRKFMLRWFSWIPGLAASIRSCMKAERNLIDENVLAENASDLLKRQRKRNGKAD